jgi:hypothetical protein
MAGVVIAAPPSRATARSDEERPRRAGVFMRLPLWTFI